jgi:hypothetical protein
MTLNIRVYHLRGHCESGFLHTNKYETVVAAKAAAAALADLVAGGEAFV